MRRTGSGLAGLAAITAVAAAALLAPDAARACAVCFGGAGDSMTHGMNNGILTLLGVVGIVQIGFAAMFWSFWRRSRDLKARRERFHLVNGGSE